MNLPCPESAEMRGTIEKKTRSALILGFAVRSMKFLMIFCSKELAPVKQLPW